MPNGFSWVGAGKVGGMRRPGSHQALDADLKELKGMGVAAIVSLTEISLDREALDAAEIIHIHIPIPDFQPPTLSDIRETISFIQSCLSQEKPVAVHCLAGLGRTGTILACWLVSDGLDPESAIYRVRSFRPGSVETLEQERSVYAFADYLAEVSK